MRDDGRWRSSVIAACAVALALRLVAIALGVGFTAPPDARADRDQVDYEATGWELAQGHGFAIAGEPTWFRPPGTSLLVAGVYALAGRSFATLRVVLALLSAATCGVVALAGRRAFGAASGAAAAWLLALDPAHAWYAMHFGSETPYGLLIAGAVALALVVLAWVRDARGDGDRLPAEPLRAQTARAFALALATGLALGAAILVRPQAAFVVPLALLLALATPHPRRRRALATATVAALTALLLPLAWMARNELRFGHFAIAAVGATTLYGANNPQVASDPALCGAWVSQRAALGPLVLPRDETLYAERSVAAARAFVRGHWRELPRLEACKLARLVAPRLATPSRGLEIAFAASWLVVAALLVVGLWSGWRRARAATAIVALPLGALVLTTLVFYGAIRFRHSTEPILVLLAAHGLVAIARRVRLRSPSLDGAAASP